MIYQVTDEQEIAQDFIALLKTLVSDPDKADKKHPTYQVSCAHADDMAVHLYGAKPVKLLEMVRPREEAETKAYRLQAYEPTTKATAEKALAVISKIFNPTLYTIQWKDQTDSGKALETYALIEYPDHNSVVNFLQQTALKKMLADPNGVMAVCLRNYDLAEHDRPEAKIKIFGSKNIWYFDEQMYLIFRQKITGARTEDGKKRGLLYYFDYFDANSYVGLEVEVVTSRNINVEETYRYDHNSGEMPVWKLGGIPETLDNGDIVLKSFFEAATPFWNMAINHESDLFGAYINHLHPIRAELAEECDYVQDAQRCKHGYIVSPDTGERKICPSCGGTGMKSVRSPFGVYRYNREKLGLEGGAVLEPVQFVTVPTEPTKMLEERVDRLHERGLNALNMDILNRIGENQSGVAKVIDRDELYDFMYRISTIMFDVHLVNIFHFFNLLMFCISDRSIGADCEKNLPDIQKPVQFDITSAIQLIAELKEAKDSGINAQFIRQKQKKINDKEFASNPDVKNKLNLMLDLDPAPELGVDDMSTILMNKLLSKEDAVIHTNIETFVDRAIEENENFAEKKHSEQMEILRQYAKEYIEANKEKLDISAIDTEQAFGQPAGNNQPGNQPPGNQNNPNPKPNPQPVAQ